MSEFEEQYLDVLQNIEAALVGVIRDQPKILDYDMRERGRRGYCDFINDIMP